MSQIDDGGPAFPAAPNPNYTDEAMLGQRGMSLRDYFAAQVLAVMCANEDSRTCPTDKLDSVEEWRDTLYASDAQTAYRYADAMLAARKKGGAA